MKQYDPLSLDSKITLILERLEHMAKKLEDIETQTKKTNGRVTKLEGFEERQYLLNAKVIPLVESADVAKGTWFTFKNLMLGISFLLGLIATLLPLLKQ